MAQSSTITISDKKILSLLVRDDIVVRDLFYRVRLIDERSRGKRHPFRLERLLRETARGGVVTSWPGVVQDTQQLVAMGILEYLGTCVEIHDAREAAEDKVLHILSELGRDVARYMFAVRGEETRDRNALQALGAKGRRALRKIKDTAELPTAEQMLEDLFSAGMVERTGRGGKVLSPARAKQLRLSPLDRNKLRPTARYRRTVERCSKTGSYLDARDVLGSAS